MKARAPTRIDLAGGWTDVPLYAAGFGGEVVNFAINLHATATVATDDDGCLISSHRSTTPLGGGLVQLGPSM